MRLISSCGPHWFRVGSVPEVNQISGTEYVVRSTESKGPILIGTAE